MLKKKSTKGEQCRNCSTSLTKDQNFCPACGQKNDIRRLSIREYISESLGNFFAYDSKIIRSLVPFFSKPGMLSRKYVDGEKAKYVVPFRMYMFFSLLFFLLTGMLEDKRAFNDFISQELPKDLAFTETGIATGDTLVIDSDSLNVNDLDTALHEEFNFNKAFQYASSNRDSSAEAAMKYMRVKATPKNIKNYEIYLKWARMDRLDFVNTVLDRLPLMIFLFMPFLAIAMKLFYVRRDVYYSEHLTFLLQSNSMIFLLASLDVVLRSLFSINIMLILFGLFTLYFFISMKNFYGQSWIKTFVKFILVGFCYVFMIPSIGILSTILIYYFY